MPIDRITELREQITCFLKPLDYVYVTVDLDGFSSAVEPGVSAPSPMGFLPDVVLGCLTKIIKSKKLIALDIAEMNPKYDQDQVTARLASRIIHHVVGAM